MDCQEGSSHSRTLPALRRGYRCEPRITSLVRIAVKIIARGRVAMIRHPVPRRLAPPLQVPIAIDPAILLPLGHVRVAVDIKIPGKVKLRRNRPGPIHPEIAPLATQLRPGAGAPKIPSRLELRWNQELPRAVNVPVLPPHGDDGPTPREGAGVIEL